MPSASATNDAFTAAQALHQAGLLREADAAYREVLARDPKHSDCLHLRGVIAYQSGRNHAAAGLIGKAIALDGRVAAYHNSLGVVLTAQGKLARAVASLRRALALMPDFAEIHNNLGLALYRQGNRERAVECYERARALDPGYAAACQNLGNALLDGGDSDAAEACFRRAIALRPDYAEAHNSLGVALSRRAPDEAAAWFRQAITLDPDYAQAHNNLANALAAHGRLDEAEASFRRALALAPNEAEIHRNLGEVLRRLARLGEAEAECRRAFALAPDRATMHQSLGNVLIEQCRIAEATSSLRRALALAPNDPALHSSLVFALNYQDGSPSAPEEEARHWNDRHGAPLARSSAGFELDRGPDKRLRIGYVSPDFRRHSVAHFLEPLLGAHDRRAVEVFGYAEVAWPDAMTDTLSALCDHWRVTVAMPDAALAGRIAADRIDVLIDLAGHSAHNRLPVFARKPAPVQATWLGYPGTTGLSAIDYRMVDAVSDPLGDRAAWSSETLVRLANGFLCYGTPANAPSVGPLPAAAAGSDGITFGSFNNPAKLTDATLDTWAAVLSRVPHSRLLLKARPFADASTCELFRRRLGTRGVATERLLLEGHTPDDAEHLAQYQRIDIGLDPFPYNGTTTTCEALWMGVPVVALRGDRHAGRIGASLLQGLGLAEWIAPDLPGYVETAAALAADRPRLAQWRADLRDRIAASPLCDSTAFARKIEAAYRTMWRSWLAAQKP